MSVYALAQLTIHNPTQYHRYADQFMGVLHRHGGKLLAADTSPQIVEGEHRPDKVVLLEFDNEPSFNAWATSPDYTAIAQDRHASASTTVLLLQGTESRSSKPPAQQEHDADQSPPTPKEGFARSDRTGAFIDSLGPLYTRDIQGSIALGLWAGPRHANARGFVHGAVLVALCDLALGRNASAQTDPPAPLVTVSLTTDFLAPTRPGTWLETSTTVQRTGKRLAFAQAIVSADGRRVAQASGVFAASRQGET